MITKAILIQYLMGGYYENTKIIQDRFIGTDSCNFDVKRTDAWRFGGKLHPQYRKKACA